MAQCLAMPSVEPSWSRRNPGGLVLQPAESEGIGHPRALPGRSEEKRNPLNGVSVLVLDDERDARDMLLAFFIRYGATVRVAKDVREARVLLGDWQPTIIVSDIAMPEEDGMSFIRQLRAKQAEEGRKPIPAVAMTGYTQDVHRWQALHAGYQAYLPKPLDLPDLLQTVIRLSKE